MAKSLITKEGDVSEDKPPSLAAEELQPANSLSYSNSLKNLISTSQWHDWRWQMRHRIRSVEELRAYFPEFEPTAGMIAAAQQFPIAITPYYLSLIQHADNSDPVFKMAVPQVDELFDPPTLREDPLEEDLDMPVPGLVHRYPDRALVISTTTCAMYCRHCTRKRVAGSRESIISPAQLSPMTDYLMQHPEIHDVIISGGDPLTMNDEALGRILAAVRSVPSVDIIRIGTRTPVTMPMRVTRSLTETLRRYHPIWINTHFNHPQEITSEAIKACTAFVDAGIPVNNQSVLLRAINDDPHLMENLCRSLVKMRVRPYYLFQCDLVRGVEHFRTPLSRGIEIMEYLRGRLSGLAIPTFVVDAPHGGGKIPLLPNYIVSMSPTHTVLRNFEGVLVAYPEPHVNPTNGANSLANENAAGVWELASGRGSKIQPATTTRHLRRALHCTSNNHGEG